MKIGLDHLIDENTTAYIEESRVFNAAMQDGAAPSWPQADPSTPEGLWQAGVRWQVGRPIREPSTKSPSGADARLQ
jgi:hypothetical protein